jgi:Tfp pilus assembly protein PilW
MMRKTNVDQKGFTLVEVLLYLTIAGTMFFVISLFLFTLLEARVKQQTISEVEQQGQQVMQLITRTIRNAQAVTAPLAGTSASSISIHVTEPTDSPTVVDISGATIRMFEGAGPAIPLTNDRIVASGLTFENLTQNDTPGSIRIQFTLSHENPEGRNEYTYQKTFYATASLRIQ